METEFDTEPSYENLTLLLPREVRRLTNIGLGALTGLSAAEGHWKSAMVCAGFGLLFNGFTADQEPATELEVMVRTQVENSASVVSTKLQQMLAAVFHDPTAEARRSGTYERDI